jgi:hypothetical protein
MLSVPSVLRAQYCRWCHKGVYMWEVQTNPQMCILLGRHNLECRLRSAEPQPHFRVLEVQRQEEGLAARPARRAAALLTLAVDARRHRAGGTRERLGGKERVRVAA